MELTNENYHSLESNLEYLSCSQYHDFCGGGSFAGCESMAMAKLRGEWNEEPSNAMLIGSYVDSYFEGTLQEFKMNNPKIFTQKGELLSGFKQAEEIIKIAEADEFFMTYMAGRKQVIMTAEMFGAKFKIKIDALHDNKAIVDLKIIKSIRERVWDGNSKVNFIQAYGYIDQGAIYQRVVKLNTGKDLPFFIAALSKEPVTDKEIIQVPDIEMELALSQIRLNVDHIMRLKNHDEPPVRCGVCDYCKSTKKLTEPISFYDL